MATAQQTTPPLVEIEVSKIHPHPGQPRQVFDGDSLNRLRDSLRAVGQLANVVVRPMGGGRYQLIAGERRWRAAKKGNRPTLFARIVKVDDATAIRMMVAENMERDDLDPIERGAAFALLRQAKALGGAGMTAEEVAKMVGVTASTINRYCRLADLPEPIQKRLREGRLTLRQADLLTQLRSKPETLTKAVIADIESNPWDWETPDDVVDNVAFLEKQLAEPDATDRAPAAKPVEKRPRRTLTELTERQALKMLKPYQKHRGHLELIRNVINALLKDLDD